MYYFNEVEVIGRLKPFNEDLEFDNAETIKYTSNNDDNETIMYTGDNEVSTEMEHMEYDDIMTRHTAPLHPRKKLERLKFKQQVKDLFIQEIGWLD